jgi:arylsulfatase A-like enzyme
MNVLVVSIDSLRRDLLDTYGGDFAIEVATPNLDRFAERAAVFDTHYAGSLPCMPARREWLTGTQEFLWRPWGPVEPFDDTVPELVRQKGGVTQLFTDHYHYFQHGSHGYYESFNGFDVVRGHEFDAYRTTPQQPDEALLERTGDPETDPPDSVQYLSRPQYARNVSDFDELDERDFFAPRVFSNTADWLAEASEWDQWFCFVDSFDVHEPFHAPEPYASMYIDEDPTDPELTNWPFYGPVDEGQSELSDREQAFVRAQYAGKVTMVDRWFGRVLDALDREGYWEDTTVIVTSDHGFMLGDHGWMGKNLPPVYDVIAHTPLMVWQPDSPKTGERVEALSSAVDLYGTMLDAAGVDAPDHRHSRSLQPVLDGETEAHRDWALYGYWGSAVNVTDGAYTYHQPCDGEIDTDCYSTTMMNPNSWFTPREGKTDAEAGAFLPYTDTPVWRFAGSSFEQLDGPMLFDVAADSEQESNLVESEGSTTDRMRKLMEEALGSLDCPDHQYERLGLES